VPEPLRQAALARVATQVTELYGSNETGIVSVIRESGADGYGILTPDASVEVVDEQDRPVPDGTPGLIRLAAPGAFEGYLNDPGLNRRVRRDGWFYPGDSGILDGRRLKVLGRADDQVNVGGLKYPLLQLEERAQRAGGAGLKDVGVVAVAGPSGLKELNIALATDGSDDRALLERVAAALRPVVSGDLHFVRLPQIPRNEMGKIDRITLEAMIVAARFPQGR
jgi:acyl-CoA synthetase (AMP-forming)/AMP-acid ligase II